MKLKGGSILIIKKHGRVLGIRPPGTPAPDYPVTRWDVKR